MVISGEAGIGKTRVIEAAAVTAAHRGVLVLAGWCLALSEELPFLPVVDALRALQQHDNGRVLESALAQCPPYVRFEIARLLPELEDVAEGAGALQRERLFNAVRTLFAAACEISPCALVVEDAHWADRSSRDLLGYLFAPAHRTEVPIVLTTRDDQGEGGWLQDLCRQRHVDWIALGPLTEEETLEQIGALDAGLSRSAARAVFARTQGHPLFTEHLVSSAAGSGELPASVRGLLSGRLADLGPAERSVAAVLAVAGRPLPEATIADVANVAVPVGDVLRNLIARRLALRTATGEFTLAHALLAELAMDSLGAAEAATLHLGVARVLATREDLALAADVAAHFAAAGEHNQELGWRVRAARHADATYAPELAAEHWLRVIELWDGMGGAAGLGEVSLAEAYFHASDALRLSGAGRRSRAIIETAYDLLSADADDTLRLTLLDQLGSARYVHDPAAAEIILQRAAVLGAGLPPSRDYVHALQMLVQASRALDAASTIDRPATLALALDAALRGGFGAEETFLRSIAAWEAMARGDRTEAMAGVEQALASASASLGDAPERVVDVALHITDILLKYGDMERVVQVGRDTLARIDREGYPRAFGAGILIGNVVEALCELGRTTQARAELASYRSEQPQTGELMLPLASLAAVDVLDGDLERAAAFWVDA